LIKTIESGIDPSPIVSSYLICATPRSGSNFLCEVLRSTGVAGIPDEYFWNPPFWSERWGVGDFPSYFRRLLREGTSPNGVFGSKMMWGYLDEVSHQLTSHFDLKVTSHPDVLSAMFPSLRYVWLTRRDKVRQGISFYRALETKLWRSSDEPAGVMVDPPFDYRAIDRLVQLSKDEDDAWRGYFQEHGIQALIIAYEDLAQDPDREARRVLTFLDLPIASDSPRLWRHSRQADSVTDEWVERYHAIKRVERGSGL
jgi:LPS sulfotransferase NodH